MKVKILHTDYPDTIKIGDIKDAVSDGVKFLVDHVYSNGGRNVLMFNPDEVEVLSDQQPDPQPEPAQSDWMAVSECHYVNLVSKLTVWFGERRLLCDDGGSKLTHICEIYSDPDVTTCNTCATGTYADAWAKLVGHTWEVK